MAYMALYRKWRPQTFDEVVEQGAVVTILKNAVMSGRIAHAYLFCGTRGTGKTTLAKIFARAVNCEHPVNGNPCNECAVCKGILNSQILDVSEIDAASNNGVDNIRAIIDETSYSSSVAKYRVYIIDEVHMLSAGAFNALLKTLEEPPENVIFILATTEPHKLPVTILSRCQRYDFKRISQDGIIRRLSEICDNTGISYMKEALGFIAQKADGAMRDAISLLDQTIAACGNNITLEGARAATGSLDKDFLIGYTEAILQSDGRKIIEMSHTIFSEGRDPSNFIYEIMNILRSVLVIMTVSDPGDLIYEDEKGIAALKRLASYTRVSEISLLIQELSSLDNKLKWAVQRQIVFEAGMLSVADRSWNEETAGFEPRLKALEERVSDLVKNGLTISGPANHEPANHEPANIEPANHEPANIEPAKSEPASIEPANPRTCEPEQVCSGRPMDPSDWKDFLSEVSSTGAQSVATVLQMNAKGQFINNSTFAVIFKNTFSKNMVVNQKLREETATDVMKRCMKKILGRDVEIILAAEGEKLPDTVENRPANREPANPRTCEPANREPANREPANPRTCEPSNRDYDGFDAAVEKLKDLSKKTGFEIEFKD